MTIAIKKVAVVGLGLLGAQIAMQSAARGYRVAGYDPVEGAIDIILKRMAATSQKEVAQGAIDTGCWPEAATKIKVAGTLADAVADADLVIEAVPEQLDMKRKIWAEMDAAAPNHALLATNSSSMPVSMMEDATRRPDKCLNLHFYQMTHGRFMADVMGGSQTTPDVLDAGCRFVASMGLVPLKVNRESLGFCFNRIWRAVKRETLHMWAEGLVDFRDVDRAWMIFNSTARGPFALMDAVGLDVVHDIEQVYYQASGEERDRPPQALKDMVDEGRLGVKSGRGFYAYPNPEYNHPDFLDPQKVLVGDPDKEG